MAQKATEWLKQLAQEAGYSPEETNSLVALATKNQKFEAGIDTVLKTAQDDYNAQVGRVRSLEQTAKDAQAKVDAYNAWWTGDQNKPGAYAEYQKAIQERDAALAKLAGSGPLTADQSGKFVTKDDLNGMLMERDGRYASAIKEVTRLASRHAARFHEELDTEALDKICQEDKCSPSDAYAKWIKPRADALEKERIQKEKDEYADQKVKDALSRHKLPVDPVPQETAPLYRHIPADQIPKDMDGDLLAAWHGAK